MKIKMKKIIIWLLAALFIVIPLAKDFLAKTIGTVVASQVLGAPVHIESVSVGLIRSAIAVKGLKIYNPKGFPEDTLLDMPLISLDYSLREMLQKKLHLSLAQITVKEVTLVKNKQGKLNTNSLKVTEEKKETKTKPQRKTQEMMPFQIDTLTLELGRVIVKDYTGGGDKPYVQTYDIGMKKAYKNINNPAQLTAVILSEAMAPTALKGASVYGIAALAGVAILPVGVGAILSGEDSASSEFASDLDKSYSLVLSVLKDSGKLIKEDKNSGLIEGNIKGTKVTIKIIKTAKNTTEVTVSARKLLIPRPEVARGLLYSISQKLK